MVKQIKKAFGGAAALPGHGSQLLGEGPPTFFIARPALARRAAICCTPRRTLSKLRPIRRPQCDLIQDYHELEDCEGS